MAGYTLMAGYGRLHAHGYNMAGYTINHAKYIKWHPHSRIGRLHPHGKEWHMAGYTLMATVTSRAQHHRHLR